MLFFFNLVGAVNKPDNNGVELPNLGVARLEAVRFAGEYLHACPEVAWLGNELRLEVTDEGQLLQFTLIVLGVDAPSVRGSI